ncbi:TRAP transporter substrate-binding protein [Bradyrhizobium barranii]|uniref:TRAP transporter substrate-binding protein n=1 Tax=Bradyrhizobium barranii TaxID=2992140 RepID=A0ABY3QBZ1_9BRAD|nr:TRAP transporter substrate-binding protein [Bradyrhizobium japonicum]UFW82797.1 TRAP transporter substrate-binding protein [Bradyrhizobium japonicum]
MPLSRRRFLAASAAASVFAPSLALAQAKEFRLGLITPNGHSWNKAALKFGDDLKAATNGRLTLTVFHSGQLGNEPAMMQQLQSGALDMGFIQAAELGSRVPHIAAINAPYIVRSTPAVAKFVRHPAAVKLFEVLPQETGTIGLGWGITGMRAVFSSKDLNSLADIKGMKLRINPTPVYRDFYSSLGAAPTPQVFDAMANGQVDGLEADLEFSWNQRFDKVSKVILQMNAVFMPMAAVVSGRVWQTLPAADRELIAKTVKSTLDAQIDELAGNEPALIENFKNAPIPIRQVPPGDTEAVIAEFDKIWLPKAPVLADLRKVGATL